MRKCFISIIATILLCTLCLSTALADKPADKGNKKTSVDTTAAYGRLTIEEVGIDVGLYNSNSQAVCDAVDSACFYHHPKEDGMIIADHAGQSFKTLTDVEVGTVGSITRQDGSVITIECKEVFDGHNDQGLVDENGNNVAGSYDYLTYTCLDSTGKNIRICQWEIIDSTGVTRSYDKQFDVDKRTTKNALSDTKGNSNNGKNNKNK